MSGFSGGIFLHLPKDIILYFTIYSFLGWCTEVSYAYYKQKKFVNRGFLKGPFCPIYGFGVVLVVFLLKDISNIILVFILSIIITSALEYLTGLVLETLFRCKWWDYSENFMNIKGRICLSFSIFWGIVCVFIIKCVHPIVNIIVNAVHTASGSFDSLIPKLIFMYFWTDLVITIVSMYDLKHILQTLHDTTAKYEAAVRDKIDDSAYVAEINKLKEELRLKKTFLYGRITNNQRRLLRAFPTLKSKSLDTLHDMINDIKKYISENKLP